MATPASGVLRDLEAEADSQLQQLMHEAHAELELRDRAQSMREQVLAQLRSLREAHRVALGEQGKELKSPIRPEPPLVQLRRLLVKQDDALESRRKRISRLQKRLEQRMGQIAGVMSGMTAARHRLDEHRRHRVDMDVVYDKLSRDALRAVRRCAEVRASADEAEMERDEAAAEVAQARAELEAITADITRLKDAPPSNPVVDSVARGAGAGAGARSAAGEAAMLQARVFGRPRLTMREEMGDGAGAGVDALAQRREAAQALRALGADPAQTAQMLSTAVRIEAEEGAARGVSITAGRGLERVFGSGRGRAFIEAARQARESRSMPALPRAQPGGAAGGPRGAGNPVLEPLVSRRGASRGSGSRPRSRGAASIALLSAGPTGRLAARAVLHHGADAARASGAAGGDGGDGYADVIDVEAFEAERAGRAAEAQRREAEYRLSLEAAELGRRVRGRGSDLRAAQRAAMESAAVAEARQAVGIGTVSAGLAHLYLQRRGAATGGSAAGKTGEEQGRWLAGRGGVLGHGLRSALERIERAAGDAGAEEGGLTVAEAARLVATWEAEQARASVASHPDGRVDDSTRSALDQRKLWDGIRTRLKGEASTAKFEHFRRQMQEAADERADAAERSRAALRGQRAERMPTRSREQPSWRQMHRALESDAGVSDLIRGRRDMAVARAARASEELEGRREALGFREEEIRRERAGMEEAAETLYRLCLETGDSPEELVAGEEQREKEVESLAEQATEASAAVSASEESWREAAGALQRLKDARTRSLEDGGDERRRRQLGLRRTQLEAERRAVERQEVAARALVSRVVRMLAEGAEETEPAAVARAVPVAEAASMRRAARLTTAGGRGGGAQPPPGGGGPSWDDDSRSSGTPSSRRWSPMHEGGQTAPLPVARPGAGPPPQLMRPAPDHAAAGPGRRAGQDQVTPLRAPRTAVSPTAAGSSPTTVAAAAAPGSPSSVGSSPPLRRARSLSLLRIARASSVASPSEMDVAALSPMGATAAAEHLGPAGDDAGADGSPLRSLGRARTFTSGTASVDEALVQAARRAAAAAGAAPGSPPPGSSLSGSRASAHAPAPPSAVGDAHRTRGGSPEGGPAASGGSPGSAAVGIAAGSGGRRTPGSDGASPGPSPAMRREQRQGRGRGRRRSLVEGLAAAAIAAANRDAGSDPATRSPSRLSAADVADRVHDTFFPAAGGRAGTTPHHGDGPGSVVGRLDGAGPSGAWGSVAGGDSQADAQSSASPSRATVGGTVKLAGVFEPSLPELEEDAAAGRDGGEPGALDAAGALRWVQQLEAFVSEVQALEQLLAARRGAGGSGGTDGDDNDGDVDVDVTHAAGGGIAAARAKRGARGTAVTTTSRRPGAWRPG